MAVICKKKKMSGVGLADRLRRFHCIWSLVPNSSLSTKKQDNMSQLVITLGSVKIEKFFSLQNVLNRALGRTYTCRLNVDATS